MVVYRRLNFLNKVLEIWIQGEVDEKTGGVVTLSEIRGLIKGCKKKLELLTEENFVKELVWNLGNFLEKKEVDWSKIKVRVWGTQDTYAEDELVNPKKF